MQVQCHTHTHFWVLHTLMFKNALSNLIIFPVPVDNRINQSLFMNSKTLHYLTLVLETPSTALPTLHLMILLLFFFFSVSQYGSFDNPLQTFRYVAVCQTTYLSPCQLSISNQCPKSTNESSWSLYVVFLDMFTNINFHNSNKHLISFATGSTLY